MGAARKRNVHVSKRQQTAKNKTSQVLTKERTWKAIETRGRTAGRGNPARGRGAPGGAKLGPRSRGTAKAHNWRKRP